jgi:hypothetical protein
MNGLISHHGFGYRTSTAHGPSVSLGSLRAVKIQENSTKPNVQTYLQIQWSLINHDSQNDNRRRLSQWFLSHPSDPYPFEVYAGGKSVASEASSDFMLILFGLLRRLRGP